MARSSHCPEKASDPLGTNFQPGDQVWATNFTTLNMFEANFFCYDWCEECGPRCRWAVEGWWKTGVCGTHAYQSQDPIISELSGEVRPARSGSDAGVGFIGGLNGTVIYRLTDVWGIRAGYNCYWLTSAALAPTQYDFGVFADSGSGINDNGSLFLHGVNLGVEARW